MTERRLDHLDPATIAALVERTLTAEERAAAESHLAVCADCREVWVETSEIEMDARGVATPGKTRDVTATTRPRSRQWIYAGAGLAAAAAIALAVFSPQLFDRGPRPELRDLVEAVGENRRTEGRLTGGFHWGPVPSASRSGNDAPRVPADVEVEVARLRQEVERSRTPTSLAALGSASLVAGRLDDAVAALEDATSLAPSDAHAWSDLAAAYLERSKRPADAIDLPKALEAANAALRLDGMLLEARFNRALVLERLKLRPEAIAAWNEYAGLERDARWSQEARERARALAAPENRSPETDAQPLRDRLFDEILPRWAVAKTADQSRGARDEATVLATTLEGLSDDRFASDVVQEASTRGLDSRRRRGYQAYGRGRREYVRNAHEQAFSDLEEARTLLEGANSALAVQAQLYAAISLFRQVRLDEAWSRLTAARAAIGARPYFSPLGRIEWMLGTLAARQGRQYDAIGHYETARSHFERAREWANVGVMESITAFALDQVGDARRAWTRRLGALARSDRDGVLLSAADAATRLSWLNVADTFLEAAADRAGAAGRFPSVADARRAQAETELRRGDLAAARRRVAEAYEAASKLEGATREGRLTEIALTEARVADARTAPAAWKALERAASALTTQGQRNRLPELYAARARLFRVAGRRDEARRELEAALAAHDEIRASLPAAMHAAFADAMRRVADELISLHVESGAHAEAASAVDWLKGRDLDARHGIHRAIGASLAGKTALLYFVRDTEVLAWAVTERSIVFRSAEMPLSHLTALVRAAGWPTFNSQARSRLHDILIAPFQHVIVGGASELLVVPDGPLHALAFSSLGKQAESLLVDGYSITMTPSLRAWALALPNRASPRSLAALGNPRIDARAFPDLPDLPDSTREVQALAAAYATSATFTGDAATGRALIEGLRTADVVHFAGHALINEAEPDLSSLVLTNGATHSMSVRDIRSLQTLRAQLVVLAACRGSSGVTTRTEGPMSLARAFIAAGVPRVIASHWPVDDHTSRALFVRFHQEYARGLSAAHALRNAQLALARDPDSRLRAPAAWSGFVLVEAGTTNPTREMTWR